MTDADRIAAYANVPHGLAEIVVMTANRLGYPVKSVRREGQTAPVVAARRVIAHKARAEGYSYPQIGRALNRDHTTVMSLLRGKVR